MLDQLADEEVARILGCIELLQLNPYRDMERRVELVLPLVRRYRHAFPCGRWAIAYHLRTEDEIYIDAIGPQLPPA